MQPQAAPTPLLLSPFQDAAFTSVLAENYRQALPEIALLAAACLLYLLGLFVRGRGVALAFAAVSLVIAGAIAFAVPVNAVPADMRTIAPLVGTGVADAVRWIVLGCGLVFLLISSKELTHATAADYLASLLVIVAGASLVGRANDLITLYLALELVSIPTYVLLYLPAQTVAAQEAAAKYFLLSVMSSAIMLFGFSYLFGITGSTNLTAIAAVLSHAPPDMGNPMATLAAVLAVAGLGFRVTAVPFHFYAPDVYQGGPTGVVAQLAVLPKIAGFVALAKIVGPLLPTAISAPFPATSQIPLLLWVLAALSMTVGNVFALVQDDLKRLLAYSGVAHAGYMLMALAAGSAGGTAAAAGESLLFYLIAYALMTAAAFAVLAYLHRAERPAESVDDLAGVGTAHPVAGFALSVSLLSLIGLPLFAGFTGKLLLFVTAFRAPEDGVGDLYKILVLVAAVNAAIGAVYYLKLLGVMYLRTPLRPPAPATGIGPLAAALLCTVGTLAIGAYPQPLVEFLRAAVGGK